MDSCLHIGAVERQGWVKLGAYTIKSLNIDNPVVRAMDCPLCGAMLVADSGGVYSAGAVPIPESVTLNLLTGMPDLPRFNWEDHS